jgi:type VI secretion system protein ImpL
VNIDLRKVGERTSTVPGAFKRTVEFGIGGTGSDTSLAKYISKLDGVRGDLARMEDAQTGAIDPRLVADKLDDAYKNAQDLIAPFDDKARSVLSPLLTNPLKIVTAKLPTGAPTRTTVQPTGRLPARFPRH